MTERPIVWAPRAVAQLLDGLAFIARDKPRAAHELGSRVVDETTLLREFPQAGRMGRRRGTRELVIAPFVIVYRVRRHAIEIVALWHASQSRGQ